MKVKKFRIRPRLSSVARQLKSILSVKQLPLELEDSLPKESELYLKYAVPTAFYQTWNRDEMPVPFRKVFTEDVLHSSVAISVVIASIGAEPEEYLSQLLMNGETQRAQIITAFSEECVELSFQFILKLLANDAKSDDCEISDPVVITDTALLQESLNQLEASQEGITIDTAQHLTPRFTRVALVAWTPISKKKRASALPKKRAA
jgi:hypothetical protein